MTLLVEGSTGQSVRNAQTALNYHLPDAQPPLAVDGIFGPKTKARVLLFQKDNDLVVDAIIGPRTSEALYTFVDLSFHIVTVTTPVGEAGGEAHVSERGRSAAFKWPRPKDWPRLDPLPLPPLPFKFPRAVPPLPPLLLQRPRLSLDPLLTSLRKRLTFDLAFGVESSIQKNVGTGEVERDLVVLADGRLTVWSRPIGRHLTMSGGGGLVVERRLWPTLDTQIAAYVFAKAEIKPFKAIGPLELAKIEAGLQFGGALGKNRPPPDLTTSVCVGPEVEALEDRLSFGIGGCFDYVTDGKKHTVAGRGTFNGTWHF